MKRLRQMVRNGYLAGALTAVLASQATFAADQSGWYVGAAEGTSRVDIDEAQFDSLATGSSTTSDEKDTGTKLLGGYQLTRNWAIEIAYVELGKFTAKQTVATGTVDVEFEPTAWNLAAVGMLPLGEDFTLFGKLGVASWNLDYRCATASGALTCIDPASRTAAGTDLSFGVGVRYALTRRIDIRVEWERFQGIGEANATRGTDSGKTGQSDVDLVAIGLQFKFF